MKDLGYIWTLIRVSPIAIAGVLLFAGVNFAGELSNRWLGTRFDTDFVQDRRHYLEFTVNRWCPPDTEHFLKANWFKWSFDPAVSRTLERCTYYKPLDIKPSGWYYLNNNGDGVLGYPPSVNLQGDVGIILRDCKMFTWEGETVPMGWQTVL